MSQEQSLRSGGSTAKGKEKEVIPRPNSSDGTTALLEGERVHFVTDQFPPYAIDLLSQSVSSLGGTVVEERSDASIVLVNPASHNYPKESDSLRAFKKSHPDTPHPPIIPYHSLAICKYTRRKLHQIQLSSHVPYFVHPDRSRENGPLKVWVSVNVHKTETENAYEAQAAVSKMLEQGGALIVDKRKHADILVVDRTTSFYSTVVMEQKRAGRDWQRIVEREWVEDAVKNEKMLWPNRSTEGDDGVDSMAEEEPIKQGRGPGRPTGKARVEYSREDDDFLCRYLAAHHPAGSWQSRKTYQTLAKSSSIYPIAERHTEQSWHERFKKGAAGFTKQIERYMAAGIDRATLKTKEERAKTARLASDREQAEKERGMAQLQEAQTPVVQIPSNGTSAQQDGEVAGEGHRSVAEREGARLTQLAASAVETVVEPPNAETSSDKENVAPKETPASTAPKEKRTRLVESDSDEDAQRKEAIPRPGPAQPAAPLPDVPPVVDPVPEPPISIPPAQQSSQRTQQQPARQPINGHLSANTNADHTPAQASPKKTVRMDLEPVAMQAGPSTHRLTRDSEPARPPSELPSPPDHRRQSLPTTISVLSKGTPQPARLSDLASKPSLSTPTLSPSVKRSRVQEEIMTSSAKRYRAEQRRSFRGSITPVHTPDTVLASTSFPPRVIPPPPSPPTPQPVVPRRGRRQPTPEDIPQPRQWTEEERSEAILAGQRLVLKKKEEYKVHIRKFCLKYGLSPTQLYGVINDLPKTNGGSAELYWDDIEGGLKGKFGF